MADLPDYYTQAQISEAEAAGIKGGLGANKSATPVSRDIYLATDSHILYVCFADGTWTGFDAAILTQGTLTLYANMVGGGHKITNIADPTLAQDAATRAYVLARVASYLPLAGGTMAGAIAMGTNKITGLGDPVAAQDAATKASADSALATHAALTITHGATDALADQADIATHAALTTGVHGVTGTVLGTEDVDDTPVDAATTDPISSNWAYDHTALPNAHHARSHDHSAALDNDLLNPMASYRQDAGGLRVSNPKGGACAWGADVVGAIQIEFPVNQHCTWTMYGRVYHTANDESFSFEIIGWTYIATPVWLNTAAKIIGRNPRMVKVRFARDAGGTIWYVILGEVGDSLHYAHIVIDSVSMGYGASIARAKEGWVISNVTDLTGYNIDRTIDDATIQQDVRDQIEVGDLKAPTKALAMNTQKLTGVAAPAAATDAARKSEVDAVAARLDDVAQTDQTASRAIDGTVYQNTSGKIRVVTVTVECDITTTGTVGVIAACDSANPPTTNIAKTMLQIGIQTGDNVTIWGSMTFIVAPSYYYKVTSTGAPTLYRWIEWDLL